MAYTPRNHLVLLGSYSELTGATTYGTGILVIFFGACYLVTCRHVIKEAGSRTLFGLPKPRKTKNPPGGYKELQLGSPKYHPLDSSLSTFDIAVLPVLKVNRQSLASQEIIPIDLITKGVISVPVSDGQELSASGYPTDYAKVKLSENINEPLLPKNILGTTRSVTLVALSQSGFGAPLKEGFFAQTTDTNACSKGMSGGIVCLGTDELFAGIVLASGEIEVSSRGQCVEKIKGFVFAGAERVLETLQAI